MKFLLLFVAVAFFAVGEVLSEDSQQPTVSFDSIGVVNSTSTEEPISHEEKENNIKSRRAELVRPKNGSCDGNNDCNGATSVTYALIPIMASVVMPILAGRN